MIRARIIFPVSRLTAACAFLHRVYLSTMYGVCICVPYVSRRCQRCRRGWRRETSPRQLAKTKGPGREKPGRRERDSARAAREAPLLSFLRRVRLFLLHSPPPFSYLALPLFPNPPYPPLPPLHRRCRRLHRRYHTTLRRARRRSSISLSHAHVSRNINNTGEERTAASSLSSPPSSFSSFALRAHPRVLPLARSLARDYGGSLSCEELGLASKFSGNLDGN